MLALATLAACSRPQQPAGTPPPPPPPERPWSVQLHVHGSMSEGTASWARHSKEAERLGVDVLWWSDHDWMMSEYRFVQRFGFEAALGEVVDTRPEGRGQGWVASLLQAAGADDPACALSLSPDRVEGETSLRIEAGSDPCGARIHAGNKRGRRAVASQPHYLLSVKPESGSPPGGAEVILRFLLSVQPAQPPPPDAPPELAGGVPRASYTLEYRWPPSAASDTYLLRADRRGDQQLLRQLPLELEAGRWTALDLDLAADIARAFPWLAEPEDNTAWGPVMLARGGAALFDDYRVSTSVRHQAMLERAGALAADLERRGGGAVRQLVGVEVSLCQEHLNVFLPVSGPGRDFPLLDYTEQPPDCASAAVEAAHARGGLISLNHPMGIYRTTSKAGLKAASSARERYSQSLRRLRREAAYGADILEVGYPARGGLALGGHLALWDDLAALDGLLMTGTGVSDHHDGDPWDGIENNFVTWVSAPTPDRADLVEGLRAGRATFGPVTFEGALDLSVSGLDAGAAALVDRAAVTLSAAVEGAPPGATAVVVERPLGGGTARRTRYPVGTGPLIRHRVDSSVDTLVRVEVWADLDPDAPARLDRDAGTPLIFSNPIYLLRSMPAGGLPRGRAALLLGPARLVDSRGVSIGAARWDGEVLAVEGRGYTAERAEGPTPGSFVVRSESPPAAVALDAGPGAGWVIEQTQVRVWGLDGPFALELRW